MPETKKRRLPTVLLYGLDGALAGPLGEALVHCSCHVKNTEARSEKQTADIVFCAHTPDVLNDALSRFKATPVVVVSRLPEVDGWLDALEAGAADYCAAPFETAQLQWLLDSHTKVRAALYAA